MNTQSVAKWYGPEASTLLVIDEDGEVKLVGYYNITSAMTIIGEFDDVEEFCDFAGGSPDDELAQSEWENLLIWLANN